MSRSLTVDPSDAVPLWKQIEGNVRRLVASGALRPGAAVPSVRDLARELSINPATVAKGYQRLVDAGILSVRRGEGTFVAERPPAPPRGEREKELEGGAMRYAALAVTLGVANEEAVERVKGSLGFLRRKRGEEAP
ncbi:MAG TPA: GntR family transcriptional regulator [Thermoanaerobaculia bacterium]|nr:GntR family transcriptional regulator [Thermoanaerobaculia bacterium]